MLQTHPRNEPISRRPFLFPFLFLYFSLLLLLSVLSYKYLIGVRFARKDATRRPLEKEREFFLSSISGGQNVPTWRTKREQLKDTLITPRPSCLLWCTRETIGPQGPKNSSTRSLAGEISFFFLLFSFFCVTRVLGHISPSWRYEYEVSTFRNGPRNCYVRWRTFQPRPRA